jgi:hypothetical protein
LAVPFSCASRFVKQIDDRLSCFLELGPTTIRVEGCAIGICGGQNMTRIK